MRLLSIRTLFVYLCIFTLHNAFSDPRRRDGDDEQAPPKQTKMQTPTPGLPLAGRPGCAPPELTAPTSVEKLPDFIPVVKDSGANRAKEELAASFQMMVTPKQIAQQVLADAKAEEFYYFWLANHDVRFRHAINRISLSRSHIKTPVIYEQIFERAMELAKFRNAYLHSNEKPPPSFDFYYPAIDLGGRPRHSYLTSKIFVSSLNDESPTQEKRFLINPYLDESDGSNFDVSTLNLIRSERLTGAETNRPSVIVITDYGGKPKKENEGRFYFFRRYTIGRITASSHNPGFYFYLGHVPRSMCQVNYDGDNLYRRNLPFQSDSERHQCALETLETFMVPGDGGLSAINSAVAATPFLSTADLCQREGATPECGLSVALDVATIATLAGGVSLLRTGLAAETKFLAQLGQAMALQGKNIPPKAARYFSVGVFVTGGVVEAKQIAEAYRLYYTSEPTYTQASLLALRSALFVVYLAGVKANLLNELRAQNPVEALATKKLGQPPPCGRPLMEVEKMADGAICKVGVAKKSPEDALKKLTDECPSPQQPVGESFPGPSNIQGGCNVKDRLAAKTKEGFGLSRETVEHVLYGVRIENRVEGGHCWECMINNNKYEILDVAHYGTQKIEIKTMSWTNEERLVSARPLKITNGIPECPKASCGFYWREKGMEHWKYSSSFPLDWTVADDLASLKAIMSDCPGGPYLIHALPEETVNGITRRSILGRYAPPGKSESKIQIRIENGKVTSWYPTNGDTPGPIKWSNSKSTD